MSILPDSLEAALLLEVPKLHKRPLADLRKELESIKGETAQLLAEKGDILMFGSKRKGEVARTFAKVAKALSLMAVVIPGGVTAFGRTFRYPHPES